VLACAAAIGLLMSLVGAFALDDDPAGLRTAYLVAFNLAGAALDMATYRLAWTFTAIRGRYWLRVLTATALATLPAALLIAASLWLFGRSPSSTVLAVVILNTFVLTGAFIAAFVAPAMDPTLRGGDVVARHVAASEGPRFAERLPRHLRDCELWAVTAEDHYLSAITSGGDALIRMRMADALRELASLEGAQTHRSWWVARAAVRGVRRGDGKVALLLPDGREAPVSRAFARDLRAAQWF
jgi:hypothetical protein